MPVPTIVEALFARADATPHALAYVVDKIEETTYDRLRENVLRTAAILAAQGLKRGTRSVVSSAERRSYAVRKIWLTLCSLALGLEQGGMRRLCLEEDRS